MNLDYNGSKGTRLDVERAITISGVQPFIYESSAANSVFHSGSIRLRKRMARGVAVSATYAYSKSIDDASSIGGGGTIVAQNPFDIAGDVPSPALTSAINLPATGSTSCPLAKITASSSAGRSRTFWMAGNGAATLPSVPVFISRRGYSAIRWTSIAE